LAAAHAAIPAGEGYEAKEYALTYDPAISFRDIVQILSAATGEQVPYVTILDAEYLNLLKSRAGVPDFVAEFVLGWVHGMNAVEWRPQMNALKGLIGHKPTTAAEYFRNDYLTRKD
jgi:NAD(P)H dehydrogenase (quinone)